MAALALSSSEAAMVVLAGRHAPGLLEKIRGILGGSSLIRGSGSLPATSTSATDLAGRARLLLHGTPSMVDLAGKVLMSYHGSIENPTNPLHRFHPFATSAGVQLGQRFYHSRPAEINLLLPMSAGFNTASSKVPTLQSHLEHKRFASGSGGSGLPPDDDGKVKKFLKKLWDWLKKTDIISVLNYIKLNGGESIFIVMTAMSCWTLGIYPVQGLVILRIYMQERRLEIQNMLQAYQRVANKEPGDDDKAVAVVSFDSLDLFTQELYHRILMIRAVDLAVIKDMIDQLSRRQPVLPTSQESCPNTQGEQSTQIDEVQAGVKEETCKPKYNISKGKPHIVKEPPPPYASKPYETRPYAKRPPVKKQTSPPASPPASPSPKSA